MENRTLIINETLDVLSEELGPNINKIFMTKELLIEAPKDYVHGDFKKFISGLYSVLDDVTDAYEYAYERIEELRNNKSESAH
jgi:hypothetical protein